jgi:hypothetical protein
MLHGWVLLKQGRVLYVSDSPDLLTAIAEYRHSNSIPKEMQFEALEIVFGIPKQLIQVDLFGAIAA